MPFPEGAFALYDIQSSIVIVRNTPKNLDLADVCLGSDCRMGPFASACLEISTYECILPPTNMENFSSPLTFSDLAQLPADAIRLLDQVAVQIKSAIDLHRTSTGQTVKASPSMPLEKRRRFASSEFGTIISGESIVGPNPDFIDVEISYKFRMPPQANRASEFEFNGSFATLANRPIVIYSSPIPDSGGKTLVVAMTTRLVSFLYDGSYSEPTPLDENAH